MSRQLKVVKERSIGLNITVPASWIAVIDEEQVEIDPRDHTVTKSRREWQFHLRFCDSCHEAVQTTIDALTVSGGRC
jgi:hypothetical protein